MAESNQTLRPRHSLQKQKPFACNSTKNEREKRRVLRAGRQSGELADNQSTFIFVLIFSCKKLTMLKEIINFYSISSSTSCLE